jgi:hypothetical protein
MISIFSRTNNNMCHEQLHRLVTRSHCRVDALLQQLCVWHGARPLDSVVVNRPCLQVSANPCLGAHDDFRRIMNLKASGNMMGHCGGVEVSHEATHPHLHSGMQWNLPTPAHI